VFAKLAVRREDPVKSREVDAWSGHQRRQPADEFQRVQHDVGRAVVIRGFQPNDDVAVACERQSLFGDGRPRDIAAGVPGTRGCTRSVEYRVTGLIGIPEDMSGITLSDGPRSVVRPGESRRQ